MATTHHQDHGADVNATEIPQQPHSSSGPLTSTASAALHRPQLPAPLPTSSSARHAGGASHQLPPLPSLRTASAAPAPALAASSSPFAFTSTTAGGGAGGGGAGGRTALHYAAEAGSFGVVAALIEHGAFVGVRDGAGESGIGG